MDMEVMAPVHMPIIAVATLRERVVLLRRRKKAADIGAIVIAIDAGLDITYLLL